MEKTFLQFFDQVGYVLSAVQDGAHTHECVALTTFVVSLKQRLKFTIRLPPQSSEPVEGSGQRGARRGVPLEGHFDFENLFQ
jgi:hypothetical protein